LILIAHASRLVYPKWQPPQTAPGDPHAETFY
jgi:hypothetical protein